MRREVVLIVLLLNNGDSLGSWLRRGGVCSRSAWSLQLEVVRVIAVFRVFILVVVAMIEFGRCSLSCHTLLSHALLCQVLPNILQQTHGVALRDAALCLFRCFRFHDIAEPLILLLVQLDDCLHLGGYWGLGESSH